VLHPMDRSAATKSGALLLVVAAVVIWAGLAVVVREPEAQAPGPPTTAEPKKKLIYYGWDIRDTRYLREHVAQLQRSPFDGIGIVVPVHRRAWDRGDRGTDNQLGWRVMGPRALTVRQFRRAIADLAATRWRRFTENFLPVALAGPSAKGLDWFDDARWRRVSRNFRTVAHVAAAGGVKGIILDPEQYGAAPFRYSAQPAGQPFGVYQEKARARGREVMREIAPVLPRVVLLSLFGNTAATRERASAEDAQYGLLPAFYDGLLEAMPPAARLVDGFEWAYAYKDRAQFTGGYDEVHRDGVKLSAAPAQYLAKTQAGFGLWLDRKKREYTFTAREWRRAVGAALDVSDRYVWIYTERLGFFPWSPSPVPDSYIEAMRSARRP
jgi:hypothetical protein